MAFSLDPILGVLNANWIFTTRLLLDNIVNTRDEWKEIIMLSKIFPQSILALPEADIPLEGIHAYLFQGEESQIIFMEFKNDVNLPEHSHADQWGIVLEGKIELMIGGVKGSYTKGDRYFIPAGVKHSGKIYAGYADITYFGQKDRYQCK